MAYAMAFIATFLLLTIVVSTVTKDDLAQLNSLVQSNYLYSAKTPSSTANDAYYKYEAGISFSVSEDMRTGVNAEIVMQTADAQYTDLVYWNTRRLGEYSIAISDNIARISGLKAGDTVFSKSVVDGVIREYTVEAILPAASYTRGVKSGFHNEGIIIMGYDEQYASNITHTCIVYATDPIEALATQCSSMPEDIIYKEDEVSSIVKSVAPYIALYILVTAACAVLFVAFIGKEISHNYRRQIALGFDKKVLNNAYYGTIGKIGVPVIAITAIISGVAFGGAGICISAFSPVIDVMVVAIISLVISAVAVNRRLWRR